MLQNINSERAVLNSFINSHKMIENKIASLKEDYFMIGLHKKIFNFIFDSYMKGNIITDDIVLSEFEKDKKDIEELLLTQCPSDKTIGYHINNIAKAYQDRQILSKLELAKKSLIEGNNVDISRIFEDIEITTDNIKISKLSEIISSLEKQLEDKKEDPINVGISEFDSKITLSNGDLIVIGARPSMGKTGFMNTIALNLIKSKKRGSAIFSLEMPSEKIMARMIANVGHIPMGEINHGLIKDFNSYIRAKDYLTRVEDRLMLIDNISEIDNIIRAIYYIKSQNPFINDFFIDHLGHIKVNKKFNSEHLKINYITKELKEVAKATGIRVWLLSQLNRSVEERTNRKPMLSDLRESGSIEEVADIVLGLYRDSYYKVKEGKIDKETDPNELDIIILKQRDGETSIIKTMFSGRYMQVGNMSLGREITPDIPSIEKPSLNDVEDNIKEAIGLI